MNITISKNNNQEILIIPIVPPNISITQGSKNETFETLTGDINILKNPALKEISLSSFFPVNKNYSFVSKGSEPDGFKYVNFIENAKNNKEYIRLVMTSKENRTIFNSLVSIENFEYDLDKVSDIVYSVDFKEFKKV
jgi:hypothetical protein